MKEIKLYNVIFPIWLLLFFPPVIFITLIGNYAIDSIIIVLCFYVFKLSKDQVNVKTFYRKNILKVWIFGFLADIIGAAILFALGICGDYLGIPYEIISGINYDPFSQPLAIVIIVCSMLISGMFIYIFNYYITFAKQVEDRKLRIKLVLTIAIITIPWTFLLPTKLFYHGV